MTRVRVGPERGRPTRPSHRGRSLWKERRGSGGGMLTEAKGGLRARLACKCELCSCRSVKASTCRALLLKPRGKPQRVEPISTDHRWHFPVPHVSEPFSSLPNQWHRNLLAHVSAQISRTWRLPMSSGSFLMRLASGERGKRRGSFSASNV